MLTASSSGSASMASKSVNVFFAPNFFATSPSRSGLRVQSEWISTFGMAASASQCFSPNQPRPSTPYLTFFIGGRSLRALALRADAGKVEAAKKTEERSSGHSRTAVIHHDHNAHQSPLRAG